MLIANILEQAGVTVKPMPSDQNELKLCCPFCIERGESMDTRFRLGINQLTGLGHCYNCDWSSSGLLTTAKSLAQVFDIPFSLRQLKEEQIELTDEVNREEKPQPTGLPNGYESFRFSKDAVEKRAKAYLHERGISDWEILKYRIGYSWVGEYAGRILFPVVGRDKQVYGVAGRTFTKQEPKYLNTPGLKILWGTEDQADRAILTEGIMDAIRVRKLRLNFGEFTTLATLGSNLSKYQLYQLKQYKEVILLPDWDRAGVKGALDVGKLCEQENINLKIGIPEEMNGDDPASLPRNIILSQIEKACTWSDKTAKKLMLARTRSSNRITFIEPGNPRVTGYSRFKYDI